MNFELDHVFICTDVEAPEADLFLDCGLTEGPPNTHPGQGTANRRFFFQNAMIELLWVHDPIEIQSNLARNTRLWDRWQKRDWHVSPFGICLRHSNQNSAEKPFNGWSYKPEYLPENHFLWIAENSDQLLEPMLLYQPKSNWPDRLKPSHHLEHKNGFREISSITLHFPSLKKMSPALESMKTVKGLSIESGKKHRMNIGFDGEQQGYSIDFHPHLPLSFSW